MEYDEVIKDDDYYIVKKDGHYGVLDESGAEIVPCEMDEIRLKSNPEGCWVLRKGDKWGLLDECALAMPVFDELKICAEEFTMARIGDEWGWVDIDGHLTQDKAEAQFGEWYDFLK